MAVMVDLVDLPQVTGGDSGRLLSAYTARVAHRRGTRRESRHGGASGALQVQRFARRLLVLRSSPPGAIAESEDGEVVFRRTVHGAERESSIEGDEAPAMRNSQREKVRVSHLPRAVQPGAVHGMSVEHADVAGPELMMVAVVRPAEQLDGCRARHWAWIAGLAEYPHEAVLGDWTRSPPRRDLRVEPVGRPSKGNGLTQETLRISILRRS